MSKWFIKLDDNNRLYISTNSGDIYFHSIKLSDMYVDVDGKAYHLAELDYNKAEPISNYVYPERSDDLDYLVRLQYHIKCITNYEDGCIKQILTTSPSALVEISAEPKVSWRSSSDNLITRKPMKAKDKSHVCSADKFRLYLELDEDVYYLYISGGRLDCIMVKNCFDYPIKLADTVLEPGEIHVISRGD